LRRFQAEFEDGNRKMIKDVAFVEWPQAACADRLGVRGLWWAVYFVSLAGKEIGVCSRRVKSVGAGGE